MLVCTGSINSFVNISLVHDLALAVAMAIYEYNMSPTSYKGRLLVDEVDDMQVCGSRVFFFFRDLARCAGNVTGADGTPDFGTPSCKFGFQSRYAGANNNRSLEIIS